MRTWPALAALAVLAIGLVLWLGMRGGAPRAGVERALLSSEDGGRLLAPRESLSAPRSDAVRGGSASNGESAQRDESRPGRTARLEAIVVDAAGNPLEGAALEVDAGVSALSDASGEIQIELPAGGYASWFAYSVTKTGFRAHEGSGRFHSGERMQLGTIVLETARNAVIAGQLASSWPRILAGSVEWHDVTGLVEPFDEEALLRRDLAGGVRSARATAVGSFVIEDLPAGDGLLIAEALGHLEARVLVPRVADGERREIAITLQRDPEATVLAGRVLRPDGSPAGRAWIRPRGDHDLPGTSAASDGTFALEVVGEDLKLRASDPWSELYPSDSLPVRGTNLDLLLVLREPRWLEIEERDAQERPISWGHVQGSAVPGPEGHTGRDDALIEGFSIVALERDGRARVVLPQVPFQVVAMAPGYRTETFGPFEPEGLSSPLALHLTSGEALEGRVVHRGRAVTGAEVSVYRKAAFDEGWIRSTELTAPDRPFVFASWTDLEPDASTDGHGRFVATLQMDGPWEVLVLAKGFPPAVFGPFAGSKELGLRDLELELPRGGALEGRVLVAPGASPSGRIVGATDEHGILRTTVADAEGRWRIEPLAPGSYQVRACKGPVADLSSLGGDSTLRPPTWDATVLADATTHFDLDLTAEDSVRLRLRWTFGIPMRVALEEAGTSGLAWWSWETANWGADGTMDLALSTEGVFELRVRSGQWTVSTPIGLHSGLNDLAFEPATGRLRVHDTREVSEDESPWFRFRLTWQEDWRAVTTLVLWGTEEDAVFETPAGTIGIERFDEEEEVWIHLREIEVRPGEETLLELP